MLKQYANSILKAIRKRTTATRSRSWTVSVSNCARVRTASWVSWLSPTSVRATRRSPRVLKVAKRASASRTPALTGRPLRTVCVRWQRLSVSVVLVLPWASSKCFLMILMAYIREGLWYGLSCLVQKFHFLLCDYMVSYNF